MKSVFYIQLNKLKRRYWTSLFTFKLIKFMKKYITILCLLSRSLCAQLDTSEFLLHTVNDYPLKLDTLSKQLTIDDTMFLDELIASDPSCLCTDSILSAYVYKNVDYTFYIEYYFKSKTITYFVCEGYIRKRQLIRHPIKKRKH